MQNVIDEFTHEWLATRISRIEISLGLLPEITLNFHQHESSASLLKSTGIFGGYMIAILRV